jgi:hypothetical protein
MVSSHHSRDGISRTTFAFLIALLLAMVILLFIDAIRVN